MFWTYPQIFEKANAIRQLEEEVQHLTKQTMKLASTVDDLCDRLHKCEQQQMGPQDDEAVINNLFDGVRSPSVNRAETVTASTTSIVPVLGDLGLASQPGATSQQQPGATSEQQTQEAVTREQFEASLASIRSLNIPGLDHKALEALVNASLAQSESAQQTATEACGQVAASSETIDDTASQIAALQESKVAEQKRREEEEKASRATQASVVEAQKRELESLKRQHELTQMKSEQAKERAEWEAKKALAEKSHQEELDRQRQEIEQLKLSMTQMEASSTQPPSTQPSIASDSVKDDESSVGVQSGNEQEQNEDESQNTTYTQVWFVLRMEIFFKNEPRWLSKSFRHAMYSARLKLKIKRVLQKSWGFLFVKVYFFCRRASLSTWGSFFCAMNSTLVSVTKKIFHLWIDFHWAIQARSVSYAPRIFSESL